MEAPFIDAPDTLLLRPPPTVYAAGAVMRPVSALELAARGPTRRLSAYMILGFAVAMFVPPELME